MNTLSREELNRAIAELRTPLTTILGFTGALLREPDMGTETRHSLLQIVRNESMKMASLLENLDHLGDEETQLSFTEFSLAELLEEVAGFYQELHPDREFSIRSSEGEDLLFSDKELLKQVILELVSNAVRFTRPQGKISLKLIGDSNEINIYIHDDGTGIAAKDLPHIGEPFFRGSDPDREHDGIGLGFHLARQRTELLGGQLTIQSQPDAGTTVIVNLPK